jgi:hypothetical protein
VAAREDKKGVGSTLSHIEKTCFLSRQGCTVINAMLYFRHDLHQGTLLITPRLRSKHNLSL